MRVSYLLFTLLLTNSFLAKAELRWYDIELIFFERPVDKDLKENLEKEKFTVNDFVKSKNIISEAYQEISQYDFDSCIGLNPLLDNNQAVDDSTAIELQGSEVQTSTLDSDLTAANSNSPEENLEISTELANQNSGRAESETETELNAQLVSETNDEFETVLNPEIASETVLPELSDIDYYCAKNKPINDLYELPLSPATLSKTHTDTIYLLSEDQLALNEIVDGLKRKGLTPILHTGWRQPESNIRNVTPIHIYGGQNISAALVKDNEDRTLEQLFTNLNQLVGDNGFDTAVDNINDKTAEPLTHSEDDLGPDNASELPTLSPPAPLLDNELVAFAMANQTWKLQGIFKVFIRKNYLTIHADFDLNELSIEDVEYLDNDEPDSSSDPVIEHHRKVSTTHFSQKRRVISSQIHYFDHPRLGIVMQIRRYNH
jgi:hypothetical protein